MMNEQEFAYWVAHATEEELLRERAVIAAALRRADRLPMADRSHEELRLIREQLFRLDRQARAAPATSAV